VNAARRKTGKSKQITRGSDPEHPCAASLVSNAATGFFSGQWRISLEVERRDRGSGLSRFPLIEVHSLLSLTWETRMGSLSRSAVAVALAWPGAGCDASLDPIEVAPGCPDNPVRAAESLAGSPSDHLIDDFEDGDNEIVAVAGRDGSWILGRETESTPHIVTEVSTRCAVRGRYAGHFAGTGFVSWGANWTAVFRDTVGAAIPYDARSYGGISFFAALPEGAAPVDLPVGVTSMDVAWNGGVCTSKCMDFYRTNVELTSSWQRFEMRFDQLVQEGTGDPLVPLRVNQMVGFILWPDPDFDLFIDDVRFED
jgi:hypothetical protein